MRVYLDTNVFIYGLIYPESNSRIVLDMAEAKEFDVFISDLVVEEAGRVFERAYGAEEAYHAVRYAQSLAEVVSAEQIKDEMKLYSGKIAEKDLPNLACARHKKVDHLISYDRDYAEFEEYATPKQFVKALGRKAFGTEY